MMTVLLAITVCIGMIAMIEYIKYTIKRWYKSQLDIYNNPKQKSR